MKFSGPTPPLDGLEERRIPTPAGDLSARLYTPKDAAPGLLPGLVYFHGGGLMSGSAASHDAVAAALANAGGCRVLSVDYRLAPEHRFPAAVEDALAAMIHVQALSLIHICSRRSSMSATRSARPAARRR